MQERSVARLPPRGNLKGPRTPGQSYTNPACGGFAPKPLALSPETIKLAALKNRSRKVEPSRRVVYPADAFGFGNARPFRSADAPEVLFTPLPSPPYQVYHIKHWLDFPLAPSGNITPLPPPHPIHSAVPGPPPVQDHFIIKKGELLLGPLALSIGVAAQLRPQSSSPSARTFETMSLGRQTAYAYSSEPRAAGESKYRDEGSAQKPYKNIMFDRRVVRGSTYAAQVTLQSSQQVRVKESL